MNRSMMRKLILTLSLLLGVCVGAFSQNNSTDKATDLMKQAQTNLTNKEYVKARYLYLRAYEAYIGQNDYVRAVDCGLQGSYLYRRENYYKQAFDICNALDYWVQNAEKKQGKKMPALLFRVNKERLLLSMGQKRTEAARLFLSLMETNAKALMPNDSISEELLYTKANYYYTFGMNEQGDKSFGELIARYKAQKEYDKVDDCYRTLIDIARKGGNAALTARTYDRLMLWTDSVHTLTAREEAEVLKQGKQDALAHAADVEASLATKNYIIIGICVVAVVLVLLLLLAGSVLLRYLALTRKQKRAIVIANEHNALKTTFIHNISAQMEPTLNTLDTTQPGVKALHLFSEHIQELSDLENSLSETYELTEVAVTTFCESVVDGIRPKLRTDVSVVVNAPKLNVKVSEEPLLRVLSHLLSNAAEFTPEGGKIFLDYKKRGAHVQQFIVSDTGTGIAEELRDNLFKPFTVVRDLTEGDGLGLPICALLVAKMNGTLSLDTTYTKGARFVVELNV
jgi:signal transduction histidine kinase